MSDLQNKLEQKVDLCREAVVFFFFFAKLNLNFGVESIKHTNDAKIISHTKVAILFANSFSIVFNVALVSNIILLFFFFFFFWVGKSVSHLLVQPFLLTFNITLQKKISFSISSFHFSFTFSWWANQSLTDFFQFFLLT